MGPGPPPRRARRTNTNSARPPTTAGTQGSTISSFDAKRSEDLRLSADTDTLDDDTWNHKRYQREDEDLWGLEAVSSLQPTISGSSVGVAGLMRQSMSRTESYYTARAPPVNDLHPPAVSRPSPHPQENHWMLQPPPKASVMSGKERATNRSRSGSGASSKLELSLPRQVSARQLKLKLDRGEMPERAVSRGSSYRSAQRHDRPKTPQTRPMSQASSRKQHRRDTAIDPLDRSSGDSCGTTRRRSPSPMSQNLPDVNVVRIRSSRQKLSTVISSGSGDIPESSSHVPYNPTEVDNEVENTLSDMPPTVSRRMKQYSSAHSSDPVPYYTKHRSALASSDRTSLTVLQDFASSNALLNTRFVSVPLIEPRTNLPPSDMKEEKTLGGAHWTGSGFGVSRSWTTDQNAGQARVPFDSSGAPERDPSMRWSVDF
jgi:hypothetical protein